LEEEAEGSLVSSTPPLPVLVVEFVAVLVLVAVLLMLSKAVSGKWERCGDSTESGTSTS
jgi:hypothetical protein